MTNIKDNINNLFESFYYGFILNLLIFLIVLIIISIFIIPFLSCSVNSGEEELKAKFIFFFSIKEIGLDLIF